MRYYDNENLLSMVEMWAEEMGHISNEDELSEKFDAEIMPLMLEAHGKPGVEFDDDAMVDEEFNNWKDGLCKEGEIHPEQYDKYCYTGKYSN